MTGNRVTETLIENVVEAVTAREAGPVIDATVTGRGAGAVTAGGAEAVTGEAGTAHGTAGEADLRIGPAGAGPTETGLESAVWRPAWGLRPDAALAA